MALGALRCQLEDPNAHDVGAHFARISRLYDKRDESVVLVHEGIKDRFRFDLNSSDRSIPWVISMAPTGRRGVRGSRQMRKNITIDSCTKWAFRGEPNVQAREGELPYQSVLSSVVEPMAAGENRNFRRSYSELCLVSRQAGEEATIRCFTAIRLQTPVESGALDKVLSVHNWTKGRVSRMRLFNARTKVFDREGPSPRLAIVDGDGAFLATAEDSRLLHSNILVASHRSLERNALERLRDKLESKSQWYEGAGTEELGFPTPPRGICIAILKQRTRGV